MSIIGTKRLREDTDDEVLSNKRTKIAETEPDATLSVFQIPELVENIIKYSLKNPEIIVCIARMSKMYATFSIFLFIYLFKFLVLSITANYLISIIGIVD